MKKVFAFGLDLEVEDWVKFLAVDLDGEVWGFDIKPEVIDEQYWGTGKEEGKAQWYEDLGCMKNFTLMTVGV